MFSKCLRNVFYLKQSFNGARYLASSRALSLTSRSKFPNQGRFTKTYLGTARFFSDQASAVQKDYTYGDDADQWTKVADNADETVGDFKNFRLSEETIKKLQSQKIMHFFPVQSNTFDVIYDEYDVIVQARTGSGKTMSYAIPLVEKLLAGGVKSRDPKMLVLTPTRELANQVSRVVESLTDKLRVVPVYGGANIAIQESQLKRGAEIVVGTPGRIIDLIKRGSLKLSGLDHVVLDEVDRMLDMGFSDDVDTILGNRYNSNERGSNPQTLLFSATVPHWVRATAKKYLSRDLKMIDLIGSDTNRTAINVEHKALMCSSKDRINVILDAIKRHSDDQEGAKVIVFCQTKREVDDLGNSRSLRGKTGILHGDISQAARENTLSRFKKGQLSCLVATDVAARGLDIPDVDVVIQCSPPLDVESYIHRSGRTGRAGKSGESIMLFTEEETHDLEKIEGIAGFTFTRTIFAKSIEDIKDDVARSLKSVGPSMVNKFRGMAEELLADQDPVDLLASAIAIISGHEQKSLINSRVGYITVMAKTSMVDNKAVALSSLPEEFHSSIHNIRILKDRTGFVFDVPMAVKGRLKKACEGEVDLENIESLPPLEQTKVYGGSERSGDARSPWKKRDGSYAPSHFRRGESSNYGNDRRQTISHRRSLSESALETSQDEESGFEKRQTYNKRFDNKNAGYERRQNYNNSGYERKQYNSNNKSGYDKRQNRSEKRDTSSWE